MLNENKRIICILLALLILTLAGCSNQKVGIFTEDATSNPSASHGTPSKSESKEDETKAEEITSIKVDVDEKSENEFIDASAEPISKITLSSSESSYLYFRSLVNRNYTFEQLRMCSYGFNIEEFLNYFDFEVNETASTFFNVGHSFVDCPWNKDTKIYRLTVKMKEKESVQPNNFVFCIDVSESMSGADILPLFKSAFPHFVSKLDPSDTVSIVTCTGTPEVLLDGCPGGSEEEILEALDKVQISNDTSSNVDITTAYEVAKNHYIPDANNRVVIVSDGDISAKLITTVEENALEGIYTSVIGLGYRNYKNEKCEAIANAGEGRYFYVDCESQGERVLGEEIFKNVFYEFRDITAEVKFDSEYVLEYRLIGYAHQSEASDGEADAEEERRIYAGDTMTLCYELKLAGKKIPALAKLAVINVKAELPSDGPYAGYTLSLTGDQYSEEADESMIFMLALIKTVMILQDSEYIGKVTLNDVLAEISELDFEDHPERAEFVSLIEKIVDPYKNT